MIRLCLCVPMYTRVRLLSLSLSLSRIRRVYVAGWVVGGCNYARIKKKFKKKNTLRRSPRCPSRARSPPVRKLGIISCVLASVVPNNIPVNRAVQCPHIILYVNNWRQCRRCPDNVTRGSVTGRYGKGYECDVRCCQNTACRRRGRIRESSAPCCYLHPEDDLFSGARSGSRTFHVLTVQHNTSQTNRFH